MIEKVLSAVAGTSVVVGILAALLLFSSASQSSSAAATGGYILAASVLVSGIVLGLLFESLAEIVRLLRQLVTVKSLTEK